MRPQVGGGAGSRTPDLLILKEALYQLSYGRRIRSFLGRRLLSTWRPSVKHPDSRLPMVSLNPTDRTGSAEAKYEHGGERHHHDVRMRPWP